MSKILYIYQARDSKFKQPDHSKGVTFQKKH